MRAFLASLTHRGLPPTPWSIHDEADDPERRREATDRGGGPQDLGQHCGDLPRHEISGAAYCVWKERALGGLKVGLQNNEGSVETSFRHENVHPPGLL